MDTPNTYIDIQDAGKGESVDEVPRMLLYTPSSGCLCRLDRQEQSPHLSRPVSWQNRSQAVASSRECDSLCGREVLAREIHLQCLVEHGCVQQ
jgi:hypothetical protein